MSGHSPIMMSTEATSENFDERAYLAQNGDVARAIAAGMFASAWDHFVKTGKQEGRRQRLAASVAEARARKLERLKPHVRTDMPYRVEDGRLNFLRRALRKETRIADTRNVSANPYDQEIMRVIETHKGGLILHCGAGRRDVYFENVVDYEIVAYDSTDVLGVGEHLPFKSNTFDAVFSIAVLEHVRDPFRCAEEIARVLKGAGRVSLRASNATRCPQRHLRYARYKKIWRNMMKSVVLAGLASLAAALWPVAAGAEVPETIAAKGETVVLQVHAEGAQIYGCKADPGGKLTWQFREPIASLFKDGKTIGRHYAGPNWEIEGGAVVAKGAGRAPGATSRDIPWLKLEVTDHRGSGPLKDVTTVQRLNTQGGNAEGACQKVGELHSEPYSADYVFLRKGS